MITDFYGRRFFTMFDPDSKKFGLQECFDANDLQRKNEDKFGVFWTVNKIKQGMPRKKENLEQINAIAFEIDEGSKESQLEKIRSNLTPSMVIETKRGFHSYFFVSDFEPDADTYRDFLLERVIHFYNADKNAADATRILRVPTFMHWKDENDPFMVRCIHLTENKVYRKKQLEKYFPKKETKVIKELNSFKNELSFQSDTDLFNKIYQANQGQLLQKLSGTEAIGMEQIEFKNNRNGTYQIIVNKKSTASWIDSNFKIGSTGGGSPTVWQWVNWYHKDHKKTYLLLKKYLPELFDETIK